MNPFFTYGAIGLVILLVVGGLFFLQRSEAQPRPAPEFVLQNHDGQEVKLSDFRGKAVVANAWAAWCPFCVKELADFVTVQKEFGEKVAIIAINRAESKEVAEKFIKEEGKISTSDLVFLLDPNDSFYQSLGGFSMPETIFVDKDGLIRFHKRGPMEVDEIRKRVEELFHI